VVGLVRRYADRLGGIHIKDCFPDYLEPAAHGGLGYEEVTSTGHLWAEPGLGVVDFDAVLAAMPEGYDGDFMIEVDVPSVDSVKESHRISFEWATAVLRSP
jgi:inosose dehydratase